MSRRRIRRPKDQEYIYVKLTDTEEFGIFSSYKDVFMVAGLIGFIEKKKKKFEGSLEGISWNVFNLETDEAIINAVALADSGDLSIINTDDESYEKKIKIFEEYAAGGAEILYKKLMEEPKNILYQYFEYIMSTENEVSEKERSLKDIADLLTF
jgi:dnd system-associated protein 4